MEAWLENPQLMEADKEASFAGVKTEEIRGGRIVVGLRDIWRVCLEILPLQQSKEKREQKPKNNKKQPK